MSTLLSAESIGVARWATDTASAYAKIREQFGRPIGQFQAIKHKCAEMIADTERATAAVWDAARAIDETAKPVRKTALSSSPPRSPRRWRLPPRSTAPRTASRCTAASGSPGSTTPTSTTAARSSSTRMSNGRDRAFAVEAEVVVGQRIEEPLGDLTLRRCARNAPSGFSRPSMWFAIRKSIEWSANDVSVSPSSMTSTATSRSPSIFGYTARATPPQSWSPHTTPTRPAGARWAHGTRRFRGRRACAEGWRRRPRASTSRGNAMLRAAQTAPSAGQRK